LASLSDRVGIQIDPQATRRAMLAHRSPQNLTGAAPGLQDQWLVAEWQGHDRAIDRRL
jgi:hypothetical protein